MDIMKFVVDYYLVDVAIGLMGVYGLALIFERTKALYFDYALNADDFMAKVMKSVENDKIEEAITYCAANEQKPLAQVIKRVLERADRDDAAIDQSLDIAASEVAPKLTKNLSYLSMVSNVVTLIGLLGTVVGLIMSFKAVSFADPSQKQSLLADGISMAMHATAAALVVAIPVMIVYSFLHSKQGRLFNEIDQHSNKLLELLRSRDFNHFGVGYPTPVSMDKMPKAKTAQIKTV
ncbi:MAG: MotA/TolQ/ExbB proton channel family protein [Bdellovibrionales bacterium]|jgi:biopolymer transport protein ExbB/TolQ|nr:MotA/TolQ/ExbB proton channel family protein [Bdellovibrionales bacterium]